MHFVGVIIIIINIGHNDIINNESEGLSCRAHFREKKKKKE